MAKRVIYLEYRKSDGLVTNAIVCEGDPPEAAEGFSLVKKGRSRAWIGWIYDGKKFQKSERG